MATAETSSFYGVGSLVPRLRRQAAQRSLDLARLRDGVGGRPGRDAAPHHAQPGPDRPVDSAAGTSTATFASA